MTKKYRNIIIALISIALMVSITACAKNEQESGEQENWMKENFPAEYLKKAKNYKAYDTNGKSVLGSKLKETVAYYRIDS